MKKITGMIGLMTMAVLIVTSLGRAAEEQKSRLTGTLDIGYYSQYISNLTGGTVFPHSDFQQSLTVVAEPLGVYVSCWHAISPKGGLNSDFGDEGDIYAGIKREYKGFIFNAGYAYYNLYNLRNTKGDLHAVFLYTQFPKIWVLTPFLNLEQDIPANTGHGGFLYRGGLGYTVDVLKQPINLNLSLAGHDGAYGARTEPISSTRFSISSDIKLWKFIATPTINFQKRLGYSVRDGGLTQDRIWWGVNFSLPLF